ncbi:MAG: PAS domain S-box protein, partial [Bacteroidia bacterium]|nr:PAS domain S-box protein [Bacteroidia bacterium]
GESIWDYPLNAEMRIEIKKNIDDALNGKSNKIETKIDAEGLSFWVELTYFPVYDNSGKLVGVALNGKDIDSNKRAELKVEQQNKKLLGIAFMQSHTLRRPIANIMGLCDLLCAEFKQEELNLMSINELMSLLVKSVSQTDNVIRNIVDSTKDIE